MAFPAYPRDFADGIPRALPLTEAAREWSRITKTPRPHRATLIRWCTKGCRGVRLCGRRAGHAWFVTRDALIEFHRRINESSIATSGMAEANPTRAGEIATALDELDQLLGRSPR